MKLYFETSYGSLNKAGEELCGDKVEVSKQNGELIIVLADGLGSGVKANILSSLTSKIVSTMLAQGATITDVIETMASTLPICLERQVAYSTFTFLHIRENGDTYIVEFDNPEIVLLRGGKRYELPRTELTIAGKRIKETHIRLKADDRCVLFSDGVVHAGVGKLLNLGWQQENVVKYLEDAYNKEATAYSLQSLLLSACNNLYMEMPGDDTTVAVIRVRNPNTACVMVGPPVNKEDDEYVVNQLIRAEGTKIICGGTTSQIVSRVTNRKLKTVLNYISPDVPPAGYIDGIDLVTEGVVTLGRALELIKRYEIGAPGSDNLLNYRKDAASLLAQTLINKCTGARFMVGRALNPAHQNPKMSIDLSIKLRLVTDIAECLKRLGKEVVIEYY